jgi:signal transduction histidine kinase
MREEEASSKATPKFPGGRWENLVSRLEASADPSKSAAALPSSQELARLLALQHRTLRGYFRLAQADRLLRMRRRAAQGHMGGAMGQQLERERKRIGRELHTSAGQALAGISVYVGILQELLPDPPEDVRLSLDRIRLLTREALDQVEGISHGLYSPAWQTQPLPDALRHLWETSGVTQKMDGVLELPELAADPPLEVRAALYRIAQEGLSNVIRHAEARQVRLSLRLQGQRLVLEISDNGRGFDPAQKLVPGASDGIGLRSMRELAGQLGGDLRIQSGPQGTTLIVSLPGDS